MGRVVVRALLAACVLCLIAAPGWSRPAALPLPLPPEPPPLATPVVRPTGPAQPEKKPASATAATPAPLPPVADETKGSVTGLPIPRFVALRTDDVNMRKGPGFRYPIDWVYKRRDLPVKILREFEVWRLVETPDGTRGWMHEATLIGVRTFVVQGADATLRIEPHEAASAVAILKVGVIGRLRSCDAGAEWCRVRVGDYGGWLPRTQFWGTLPGEAVHP
ncbi:MAG TPA: SH3 domain-containing protein [Acetobacteraceae bacterium]|jgi:SH3-like domain-containing protein